MTAAPPSIPWCPNSVLPLRPFCWHVAIVLDLFSRKVVGLGVFDKNPSATQIVEMLDQTVGCESRAPKHTVTVQGSQFQGVNACSGAYGASSASSDSLWVVVPHQTIPMPTAATLGPGINARLSKFGPGLLIADHPTGCGVTRGAALPES